MLGTSLAIMLVSLISTTSAASFSLLALTKRPRLSLPTSSSPSIITFTLQGRPPVFIMVSTAFTCM